MHRLNFLFVFLLASICAFCEDFPKSGEFNEAGFHVIPKGQIYDGDYFAIGSGVEISGTVTRDVYILGSQVIIDGDVEGDVLLAGGSVEVAGTVKGSVRAIGAQILIHGIVGKSVSVCGGNVHMTNTADIGHGVVIVGGNVDLSGNIGADATIAASNLRLAGNVKGNVKAFTGQFRVTSLAVVGGDIYYSSGTPIWVEPEASVGGNLQKHKSNVQMLVKQGWFDTILLSSKVAGFLMNLIYTFAMGWVIIKLFPHSIQNTLHFLETKPWRAILHGFVVAVVVPLMSVLLLMTILGVPFALTLIAANIVGFYTAKIYVILWGSRVLFRRMHIKASDMVAYSTGIILYFALLLIPYFGNALSIVSMLAGLGAIISVQLHRGKGKKLPAG